MKSKTKTRIVHRQNVNQQAGNLGST